MKKIIVPVDFSQTSATALRFGTYLAEVMNLDLSVIHVFDANFSFAQAVSIGALQAEKERLEEKLTEFSRQNIEPVLASFQGRMDALPVVKTEVLEGFPAQTIRLVATREDTELMVMGGVGAGHSDHPPGLFGSVARTSALSGVCPLILIPPGKGYPKVKKMAVAFGETEELPYLGGITRRLLNGLHPDLSFVHVKKKDPGEEAEINREFLKIAMGPDFKDYPITYAVLYDGSVTDRLLTYIKDREIDLLVLGGKQRGFWEGLFHKSRLKPMLNRCEVPMLIVPFSEQEKEDDKA